MTENEAERPAQLAERESPRGAGHRKGATERVMFGFAVASVVLTVLLYAGLVLYWWLS